MRKESGNFTKQEQPNLSFGEKKVENDYWMGTKEVESGRGGSTDVTFEYKNGKFFIDGKNVSLADFESVVYPTMDKRIINIIKAEKEKLNKLRNN